MIRRFLINIATVFFFIIFFVFSVHQNTAFALNQGQTCSVSEGCGNNNNLVCVPVPGRCAVPPIVGGVCTDPAGVCTLKTATNGSCVQNASDCDASKGYSCQQVSCTSSGVNFTQQCTYSCQQNKVAQGKQCTGSGQGNCASSSDVCASIANSTICGIGGVCNICQAKKVAQGQLCTGSGQGNCASNTDVCTSGTSSVCGIGGVCNICQPKNVKEGQQCTGSGQGNCTSNTDVCTSGASSVCGISGVCNICQPKNVKEGQQCTGSGQGNCASSTDDCVPATDPNACGTLPPGVTCTICMPPQSPSALPTPLPPPPSPPCKTWIDGECTVFASGLGPIATDPAGFIQTIFAILLSVSGGIALLLIIRAGYQLLTSQGKPEQLQNGRDQLIAAIVGLIFLIFSFVFLQLIGVDILHLPGFTATTNTPTTCNPSQCVPATTCQTINRGTGGTNCTPNGCPNGEECIP